MNRIHQDFRYDTTVTDVTTPGTGVRNPRRVCQTSAHVAIGARRANSLLARYVSTSFDPAAACATAFGSDASHAWFSAWAPPFGCGPWIPLNDHVSGESQRHRLLGRDYSDGAGGWHYPGAYDHGGSGVDAIWAQAHPASPHIAHALIAPEEPPMGKRLSAPFPSLMSATALIGS